jgi:superfamily II DNA/RNA helicase
MIFFGQASLEHAVSQFMAHYHAERNHQGLARFQGFHVLPIYGGQSYTPQLQSLRRGVQVVVGTQCRVMDHIKQGHSSSPR